MYYDCLHAFISHTCWMTFHFYFLIFSKKIGSDILCSGDNFYKMSKHILNFSEKKQTKKNKKKIINLSIVEFVSSAKGHCFSKFHSSLEPN